MDAEKLADLDWQIPALHGNINGVVIVRRGFIVYEKYFNDFGPGDAHNMASVTKSVVSALVGIAIDAGFIKDVNQKVLDFFPEYSAAPGDFQKRSITIRHLLTMTAPFAWKTTAARRFEPLDRLRRQRDWVTFTLNLLGLNGQTGKFQYCTAGTHLLSAVISRAAGMPAREFANRCLFKPLGMNEIPDYEMKSFGLEDVFGKNVRGWIKDPAGITVGGFGLTMTARDMARFGFLYLNRGCWDGETVVSEKWVEASTAMNPNKYGYLWWLREENGLFSFAALGSGGSAICIIPEKELVIAIAAKIIAKPRDRWELIEECILPAVLD
jgi:CubicO group peptidase (beta-lactamase class C family)